MFPIADHRVRDLLRLVGSGDPDGVSVLLSDVIYEFEDNRLSVGVWEFLDSVLEIQSGVWDWYLNVVQPVNHPRMGLNLDLVLQFPTVEFPGLKVFAAEIALENWSLEVPLKNLDLFQNRYMLLKLYQTHRVIKVPDEFVRLIVEAGRSNG